jgi:undecaprenyl diphosphate synthase
MARKEKQRNTPVMPAHIAVIMDGNGRWAKRRLMPRGYGHKAGVAAVKKIMDCAYGAGLQFLTFYAFSTENWKRSSEEIDGLFDIFRDFFRENIEEFRLRRIAIRTMGDTSKFPEDIRSSLAELKDAGGGAKLTVLFALNYGARDEIVRAFNLLREIGGGDLTPADVAGALYTAGVPDPDLIIRTGGEKRLSNFMLYQAAYSELYFTDVYWPDFGEEEFFKAVKDFNGRNRRYGG